MDKDLTSIVVVMDKSGSMCGLTADVIGGFNAFVARQREAPGRAEVTLIQFNGAIDFVYDSLPVAQVAALTEATYAPGGSTALYEAIGQAITRTDARLAATPDDERPARVVMVIMTDGHNTDRSEFRVERLRQLITERQDARGWEFVYIGAAFDQMQGEQMLGNAASLGVRAANAAVLKSSGTGVGASYNAASEAIMRYRSGGSASLDIKDMGGQHLDLSGNVAFTHATGALAPPEMAWQMGKTAEEIMAEKDKHGGDAAVFPVDKKSGK